jgi:predicted adenine nucleotide alpha hydrolase (AANH) superfamily ATPase
MAKELSINLKKEIILLHSCCAICALPFIEFFLKQNQPIVLYFDNPNIYPKKEYLKRLSNLKKVAQLYNLSLKKAYYNHKDWLNYLRKKLPLKPEEYKENTFRCQKCFEFRILKVINFCLKNNYLKWTTTLSVNRFKDVNYINNFSLSQSLNNNLEYVKLNLDPFVSYQQAKELSEKYNLYRQKYCGCEFSLKKKYK